MHCNTLTEPACRVVGNAVHSVTASAAGDVLSSIAQAISAGVRWIVENTATWWLRVPSPDLAAEPAVTRIQQWLLPITVAVAIGGVLAGLAACLLVLQYDIHPAIGLSFGPITFMVCVLGGLGNMVGGFIAAFIFASVLLAIAATAALLIWGWLWWRTREIRRAAREGDSVVIEGEYRVERETRRLEDD